MDARLRLGPSGLKRWTHGVRRTEEHGEKKAGRCGEA